MAASCCRGGRRPCVRRDRAALRPRSASTGRWRSSPAASARRDRGSRPSCRACCASRSSCCLCARSARRRQSPRARSSRPALPGSVSGAACTASSWSRASTGRWSSRSSARRSMRPCELWSIGRFNFGQHGSWKLVGNAVRMHGDQADLALVLRVAERLDDARLRHAEASRAAEIVAHQIAVLGVAFIARRDRTILSAPCDRRDR